MDYVILTAPPNPSELIASAAEPASLGFSGGGWYCVDDVLTWPLLGTSTTLRDRLL